ncbi:succinate--CoA ligase subunit alpha [Desulfovibrio inopinatus]|uniref:succinate--CoA ligase subunit alpha n=1 Tax=Desulfovibrio inopinatus TaxID=102109 RepID=UPI00042959A9|nr:succinate--CoA ligase subunit alpha [Desulfovibrio inopinatus]
MRLNEHQGKELLSEYGIAVPEGVIMGKNNGGTTLLPFDPPYVVKSQVLSGGRGKAGGIIMVDEPRSLDQAIQQVLLTPVAGTTPPYVRIEGQLSFEREYYLSLSVSRDKKSLVFICGRHGGIDVESADTDNLLVQTVSLPEGLGSWQVRRAFFHLGCEKALWPGFLVLTTHLFQAVWENGLLLAEINPLVVVDGEWTALDAKVEIGDNALALSPNPNRFHLSAYLSERENLARAVGLPFHTLDGCVGLVANGAGLAMATMDILNASGLRAANFLDLGGAADSERMKTAFRLLFDDTQVEAVFINFFGGILSCASVAFAMTEALEQNAPPKPLVARLAGNSAQEGRQILSSLPGVLQANDTAEAVRLLTKAFGAKPSHGSISDFAFSTPKTLPFQTASAMPKSLPHPTGPALPKAAETKILIQGITGRVAGHHTRLMLDAGTNIVAGVTPFKGGASVCGIPVYDSVAQAVHHHGATVSVIFVPAAFAPDTVLEAADAGIETVILITEGIPQLPMLALLSRLDQTSTRLIGPNTPGIIVPGAFKAGIMPTDPFRPGRVAVLSRSGTLTYEAAAHLSSRGLGQSICIGVGGDPFIGSSFADLLPHLLADDTTDAILMLGEVGGKAEEEAGRIYAECGAPKPMAAFIAGLSAPPGKRLGHAGAIIESAGDAQSKVRSLHDAGIPVFDQLDKLADALATTMAR